MLPRQIVRIWVAPGLHQGCITRRLIQAFLMLILRIQRNQSTNESSTLTPMTSLLDRFARKVVLHINRTTVNGGGQKTKNCRKSEFDRQWRLPSANQGFARMVIRRQYSAAITQQHHRLRLTIIMHHLCSRRPQQAKRTNSTPIKTKCHDQATILT